MKHFAVIGCPISHSRSPEIYARIFAERGVDAECSRLLVLPSELPDIASIASGLSGFAVTMPHKRAVIPYLDELSPEAEQCGAVNIVKAENGRLIGHNTDGRGLVNALVEAGFDPAGRRAAIYGRGGAALAAAYALRNAGADVLLLVRSLSQSASAAPFDIRLFIGFAERVDLFINATPLGMVNGPAFPDLGFLNTMAPRFVFDMVYLAEGETELIKTARALGCGAENGLSMLKCQALLAADIWLG